MERVYLEYLGDSIEVPVGETVVGRDVGCALRFNDPAVSRRHVRLVRRQDEVFVEDLRSSNGTQVNGRRLTAPVRVKNGDVIAIGSRQMIVHVADDDDPVESTVMLKHLESASERVVEQAKLMRAITAQIPVAKLPASPRNQRCPRCGAGVSEIDDECPKCNFGWGDFRPRSVTDVRPAAAINRRRHGRLAIELGLLYVSSELEVEAFTRDLSESGVFVCTQVLDPVGTRCELTILVDGGPPLRTAGVVRRVVEQDHADGDPIGLGVEFVNLGEVELEWIRSTITRLTSDPERDPRDR